MSKKRKGKSGKTIRRKKPKSVKARESEVIIKESNQKPLTSRKPALKRYRPSSGIAILGLIINILIAPGLGTFINRKTADGLWQLILFFVGMLSLPLTLVGGILMIFTAWLWALISSIRILQTAN